MNARTSAWLAWSLSGLSFAMFLGGFVLYLLVGAALASASRSADLSVGGVLAFSPLLAFSLVGALIASGRPGNPIGWICLAVGLLSMLRVTLGYYGLYGVARLGPLSCVARGARRLVVGALRGTHGNLSASAVPRREAALEEVASPGVVLRGGARFDERGHRPRAGIDPGPRRGSRPLRARGSPLGGRED